MTKEKTATTASAPKTKLPAKAVGSRKPKTAPEPPARKSPPTKALTDRQKELLGLFRVEGQHATYTKTEVIPDWALVKKVFLALGAKWGRGSFVFPEGVDAAAVMQGALGTGAYVDPREADFFPTPVSLAAQMAEIAAIKPNDLVLDPSAGTGRLLDAAAVHLDLEPALAPGEPRKAFDLSLPLQAARGRLAGCELVPRFAANLRARFGEDAIIESDFLSVHAIRDDGAVIAAQKILMNPPFGKDAGVSHVRHALPMLSAANGSCLVAVMLDSVLTRTNHPFRSFLRELHVGKLKELFASAFYRIPDKTFAESGTAVRTVLLVVTWRRDFEMAVLPEGSFHTAQRIFGPAVPVIL